MRHDNYEEALSSWYDDQISNNLPISPPPINNIPTLLPSRFPEDGSVEISTSIASTSSVVGASVNLALSALRSVHLGHESTQPASTSLDGASNSPAHFGIIVSSPAPPVSTTPTAPPDYPESLAPAYLSASESTAPSYWTVAPDLTAPGSPDGSDGATSDGVAFLNEPFPDPVHDLYSGSQPPGFAHGEVVDTTWFDLLNLEEVPDLEEVPGLEEAPDPAPSALARPAPETSVVRPPEPEPPIIKIWCEDGFVKTRDALGNVRSYTSDEYFDMEDARENAKAALARDIGADGTAAHPVPVNGMEDRLFRLCEGHRLSVADCEHELGLLYERVSVGSLSACEATTLQENIEHFSRQLDVAHECLQLAQGHLRHYRVRIRTAKWAYLIFLSDIYLQDSCPRRVGDMRDPPEPSTDGDTTILTDDAALVSPVKEKGKAREDVAKAKVATVAHQTPSVPFVLDEGIAGPSCVACHRSDVDALDAVLPSTLFASYERYLVAVARNEVVLYLRSTTVTE